VRRDTSGAEFRILASSNVKDNWFRVAIPTATVFDGRRLVASRVHILFSTEYARIASIHVHDAGTPISQTDNLSLSGDHITVPYLIDLSSTGLTTKGLLVSVNAQFVPSDVDNVGYGIVKFATAGADFLEAEFIEHRPLPPRP
jgi:hypothetical protein